MIICFILITNQRVLCGFKWKRDLKHTSKLALTKKVNCFMKEGAKFCLNRKANQNTSTESLVCFNLIKSR